MVADERHTVRVVDEERVRAAVTGTKHRPQVSIAGTDDLALLQAPVDLVLLEGRLEPAPESRFLAQQPFRHAVFRQELEEERPLLRDVGAEPLEVARKRLVGSERGARSPADLRREPRVSAWWCVRRTSSRSSTRSARSASPASRAARAGSEPHGPVSTSVSGSPRSSQTLTAASRWSGSEIRWITRSRHLQPAVDADHLPGDVRGVFGA